MIERALLLVGSPKGPKSTSDALGGYLRARLAERGIEAETLMITPLLASEEGTQRLCTAAGWADLLVLAFPLYFDSLPAPVIRFMELFHAERAADGRVQARSNEQRLVAIVNCGFPEARHCDTALAITRRFAVESSIEWAGGLALGGGEAIGGKRLEAAGGMARAARRSLDIAADALAAGKSVPDEALRLMAEPLMPAWLYSTVGNLGWWWQARRWGAHRMLRRRPFGD